MHAGAAQAVVAELVVALAFFRIGKDFVGLGALFEFLLGSLLPGFLSG